MKMINITTYVTHTHAFVQVNPERFIEAWSADPLKENTRQVRWRGRALSAGFRCSELAYALKRARASEHLSARWAAKEAASRLSGEPWWRYEVRREPSGAPSLHGPGGPWLLSLTHDASVAAAWVVRVSEEQVPPLRARLRACFRAYRRCSRGSWRRPQGCWSCRQRPCSSLRGRLGRVAQRTGAPQQCAQPRPCYGRGARR